MTDLDATSMVRAGVAAAERLRANIARVVIGKAHIVDLMLVAVLCEGHVLLEDMPGLGKTLLAKTFARSLGCSFRRIQFTPDLLPSDICGSRVFNQKEAEFEFQPGPIFAQVVLADEINRATPRTQSALLEAMEERQVTTDGVTAPLKRPFLVFATQNPLEIEGTFPLPEAQLDRFLMRLRLGYPTEQEEDAILLGAQRGDPVRNIHPVVDPGDIENMQSLTDAVRMSDDVRRYLLAVIRSTRTAPEIRLGGSPRASVALFRAAHALAWVRGRDYVRPDDVKELLPLVLGHRVVLSMDARLKVGDPELALKTIIERVPVPAEEEEDSVTRA
jgi:MoxR-like ATPase